MNDGSTYMDRLRERLKQKPQSRLFLSLAEELRKQDRIAEAIALLRDGIQKDPDFLAAQITLGRWYLQEKRVAAAREQFSSVLKKDPANRFAIKGLDEAGPIPEPDPSRMAEVEVLIGQGQYGQAMTLYDGLLIDFPDNKGILQRKEELAALIAFLGKKKEATLKKLNELLQAIKIQFTPKPADSLQS